MYYIVIKIMLYISCPTCGFFLGQIAIELEDEKEKICSNPGITQVNKEEQVSMLIRRLLKDRPECCKMRATTYKDITSIILPVANESI